MKKSLIREGIFVLVCMFCFSTAVIADYNEADTVTVSGKGSVVVPADVAVIHFCIETHAKKESAAKMQNDAILTSLKALDIGSQISEESYFSYEDPSSGRVTVSRCFSLTTEDMEGIPELTQSMIDSGVTGINGIWYSVKNKKPYEQEALRLAVQDAQGKAAALGLTIKLSEITDFGCYQSCNGSGCMGNGQQIGIECNVSVVYKRG